jgi:enoyl-CoA hydratase/carnithine racemase
MDALTLDRLGQPGHTFSGKEAARYGLITHSGAPQAMEREAQELARAWLEKDPLALQFTKETVTHVGTMSWDAAVNYTAAKFAELKSRQAGSASARTSGISNFLAGKSKPGLGG